MPNITIEAYERHNLLKEFLKGCRKIDPHKSSKKISQVIPNKRKSNEPNRFKYKSCERKKGYKTQGDATRAMHMNNIKYQCEGRVYYCEICGMYHITVRHD